MSHELSVMTAFVHCIAPAKCFSPSLTSLRKIKPVKVDRNIFSKVTFNFSEYLWCPELTTGHFSDF